MGLGQEDDDDENGDGGAGACRRVVCQGVAKTPEPGKKRVADRLESIKAAPAGPVARPLPGGIVQPGNVALASNGTKATDEKGELAR